MLIFPEQCPMQNPIQGHTLSPAMLPVRTDGRSPTTITKYSGEECV